MNSTFFIEQPIFIKNSTTIIIESWFIPADFIRIIATITVIIFSMLFLFIIIYDKACHTVPMMLTANSCLTGLAMGCGALFLALFTYEQDIKQSEFHDSLCVFRAYIGYATCAAFNSSFLLQAIYRYLIIVYPTRLSWQSRRIQALFIVLSWIFAFIYPFVFLFTNKIIYNIDNQICQVPLELSYSLIYMAFCAYNVPMSWIIFIYWKLVRYVREMGKRITPANTLTRAVRELKMVKRTVTIVSILLTICFPYQIFIVMSFFTKPPKYHFRIAFICVDTSLACVMFVLFHFTEPIKMFVFKKIQRRSNTVVVAIVT